MVSAQGRRAPGGDSVTMSPFLNLALLRWVRVTFTTRFFGAHRRLHLLEIGEQWGEGEWTADDLWRPR